MLFAGFKKTSAAAPFADRQNRIADKIPIGVFAFKAADFPKKLQFFLKYFFR